MLLVVRHVCAKLFTPLFCKETETSVHTNALESCPSLLRFVNGSKNSKTFVPDLSCCVPRTFPLFVSGAPKRSERSWELASCVVHVQTIINRKKKFIISSTITQNMDRNLQTLWLLDEFRSFVVSAQQNKSNPMRLEEHAFSKL